MEFNIEKVDINILPDIVDLNLRIFAGIYEKEPYGLEKFQSTLQDKMPLILIAKHDNIIIGFCISFRRDDVFHIRILGVLEPYRNHGIASRLLDQMESVAKGLSLLAVTVKTHNVSSDMLKLLINRGYYIVDIEKSQTSSKYNGIYLKLEI